MSIDASPKLIYPDWPAPASVKAVSTTRQGVSQAGVSEGEGSQGEGSQGEGSLGAFGGFNLALHVGDNAQHVQQNRQHLIQAAHLPAEPLWLEQVHGCGLVQHHQGGISKISGNTPAKPPQADASYSSEVAKVCVVMTADCLPLLICNRLGSKVAAVHAGWKGLAKGVIEATVEGLNEPGENLMVWLGPAIGPEAFEVGEDVRQTFLQHQAAAEQAFVANRPGHYLADIYQLARLRLQALGVSAIYGGTECTYTDVDHFYSYRRDGKTGRQASLIWLAD